MPETLPNVAIPSDSVLDDTPARALKFLGAVSSNTAIRAALAKRGYTEETHENGWTLVLKASGFRKGIPAALQRPEATAAIAELDAWDEPNFRVARAALTTMPEQQAFLFEGLSAQTGITAVAGIATFLDRVDALESGSERKGTRKADHLAVAKLAERGITEKERKRLRALLVTATGSPDPAALAPDPVEEEKAAARRAEQRQAKIDLWIWFNEWSECAKADIARRDHLISLGLAKRKAKKKNEEPKDK